MPCSAVSSAFALLLQLTLVQQNTFLSFLPSIPPHKTPRCAHGLPLGLTPALSGSISKQHQPSRLPSCLLPITHHKAGGAPSRTTQQYTATHRHAQAPSTPNPPSPPAAGRAGKFAAALFASGAFLGPLLDGIHGTVELNHYDRLAFSLGGLHTSAFIPPLLGAFYAVVGGLHIALDALAMSDKSAAQTVSQQRAASTGSSAKLQPADTQSFSWLLPLSDFLQAGGNPRQTREVQAGRTSYAAVALATGLLAYLLLLSANLYANEVPYWQIHAALGAIAIANWWTCDGTRQGVLLGALCAIGAPLSEVVIMKVFGLWHYPRPDLLGLPSWVAWCYAFYTPALGNLARSYWQRGYNDS